MTLVRLLNFRHLRFKWGRALLSLMGIIVGVSTFIFGPSLAETIRLSTVNAVDDIGGRAALELRGEVDPSVLEAVHSMPEVALSTPMVNGGGLIAGQSELVMFLGVDPAIDQSMRTYTIARGEFLDEEGGILLSESYAQENGYEIGQPLSLIGLGGLRTLTLQGTLSGGVGRLNSGDVAVIALPDALALRGSSHYDTVSIVPAEGQNLDTLSEQLRLLVSDDVVVDAPMGRGKSAAQFQILVSSLMSVICVMILGLGSLLIYNTMSVSVAERREEIGILRSLGVTRAQIQSMYLLESLVLGLVGSILGIALGYLLIELGKNMPVIPASSTDLISTTEISVPGWLPFVALFFGVTVPVLAGLLPSRTASNVDPTEALSGTHAENGALRLTRRRLITGLILTGSSLLIGIFMPKGIDGVFLGNTGLLLLLIGLVFLFPPLLLGVSGIANSVMGWIFGMPGLLAAGNLTKRPRRMITTGTVLVFCAFMTVLTSGSNMGYSGFIDEWQSTENAWNLTAVGAGRDPLTPSLNIPAEVVNIIGDHPDVAGTAAEYYTKIRYGAGEYTVRATDLSAYQENGGRLMWNEGDESTGNQRLQDVEHPSMLVAGFSTVADGLKIGSVVTLDTPSGKTQFEIIGSIYGVIDQGVIVMDRAVYQKYWHNNAINRLVIRLKPESDVQAIRREFQRDFALKGVLVFDNQAAFETFSIRLRSIQTVSQLLSSLVAVIMVAGLSSTIFVTVIDRRREIGMLRSVGMLRRQITTSVVLESVLLLGIASILGLPGGYLAVILNSNLMHSSLGIKFNVSMNEAGLMLFLMLLTVVLAAFIPARAAGRIDVLEAMRYE